MVKHFLMGMVFSFSSLLIVAQANNLNELRKDYLSALQDYEFAPAVYDKFEKIQNPSPQILAYKGALEAIMTKTTWNVLKKLHYLRKSEESFARAIKMAPNNLEIRFMRMAVQYEIPEYLGFSEDMEDDRKFIVDHIQEFNSAGLTNETLKMIYGFMIKCGRFTTSQIEVFKGILAFK